jgi:hypothetical protein
MAGRLRPREPTNTGPRRKEFLDYFSIVAAAVALSGAVGYWFAAFLDCSSYPRAIGVPACPISSVPALVFLTALVTCAVVLAVACWTWPESRMRPIAGGLLMSMAVLFPTSVVFGNFSGGSSRLSAVVLVFSFVFVGSFATLLASAISRRSSAPRSGPHNRLGLGSGIIAVSALVASTPASVFRASPPPAD